MKAMNPTAPPREEFAQALREAIAATRALADAPDIDEGALRECIRMQCRTMDNLAAIFETQWRTIRLQSWMVAAMAISLTALAVLRLWQSP